MKPGSAGKPLPGIDAAVVDDDGNEVDGEQGVLVLRRPWPGMLRTLYKEPERFVETYFERFGKETYLVGDAARKDSDGYFWVIGRIDDVINVSGHLLSTAEVESAIVSHPKVAEAAVIGQSDEDTGQAICAFVTLQGDDDEGSEELEAEIREHVAVADRQARPPEADHLGLRPAEDPLRQDHAPPAARHRRGPRAGRRHDPARPRRRLEARRDRQAALQPTTSKTCPIGWAGVHVAQVNIAMPKGPMDSEVMAEFAAQLDPINAIADGAPGFVWRLQDESGDATTIRPFEDERMMVNLSAWESLEALWAFVYDSEHLAVMRRRREWFEHTELYMCLWWIPSGRISTTADAIERLELLRGRGPSPGSFTFKRPFDPDGAPIDPASLRPPVGCS